MARKSLFNSRCKQCPRLVNYLKDIKKQHPDYFCKPVPAFGDPAARLLIVGLAPGLHGANRTGRPFTGDDSGLMLYRTLYHFKFSSHEYSLAADDNLILSNCRITNAVKCLPPDNKPVAAEVNNCNRFLQAELESLADGSVVLALGSVAHNAVLKALELKKSEYRFGHLSEYKVSCRKNSLRFLSSYHCSRYNTQTGRLTDKMFEAVFKRATKLLE